MQSLPDNNRQALRQVARACRKAALSSVMEDGSGAPYGSLVTVAFDQMMNPLVLLSDLSDHTRNVRADARVCLLLDGTDGHPNPQTGPRVSLIAIAEPFDADHARRRFLAAHPAASLYAGFADFRIWRLRAVRGHFVGGFGRAVWFDAPFGCPDNDFEQGEEALLHRLNHQDPHPQAQPADGWFMAGIDCDGIDWRCGEQVFRHAFAAPVSQCDEAENIIRQTSFPLPALS